MLNKLTSIIAIFFISTVVTAEQFKLNKYKFTWKFGEFNGVVVEIEKVPRLTRVKLVMSRPAGVIYLNAEEAVEVGKMMTKAEDILGEMKDIDAKLFDVGKISIGIGVTDNGDEFVRLREEGIFKTIYFTAEDAVKVGEWLIKTPERIDYIDNKYNNCN